MLDEGFTCAACGAEVPPLGRTARDHCPVCLRSLHLDINPGDRANDCGGLLEPVAITPHKKGRQIEYVCARCGQSRRCVSAEDDSDAEIYKIIERQVKG
ncbi:hypothetical protein FACS1894120_6730 [Clostridia bacterium]|nr:hypothetical protein FACS1894120_6730 [Clostridia bacterium]